MRCTPLALCAFVLLAAPAAASAQATVKKDGQWRATLGVGASHASGNTRETGLTLNADAVRASADDKISLYGNAQYARSAGVTTSDQARLGGRWDRDLDAQWFGFVGLDLERKRFANLELRGMASTGLGRHLLQGEDHSLDLFGGAGLTEARYLDPTEIDGEVRASYREASLLLGEESTHRLSDSTSFKQRLVLVPSLRQRGEYRANWDAGLAVAMSKTLSLNLGLAVSHDSEPGAGRKSTDTLLTTGVSVKFE
jgi:putative salt-induced outer membrane protein YdiY